ncbi:MAG: VOC family protein [Patescibacteria group bacterium]
MTIKELGHIVLYVTDVKKLADFYRDILGFHEIVRQGPMAMFSSGRTHHELLLIEVGGIARAKGQEPGLYHIGFKIADTEDELAQAWRELKKNGVQIVGTADHGMTHSIYILDPDGNELELYRDISDEWKTNPKAVLAPVRPLHLE